MGTSISAIVAEYPKKWVKSLDKSYDAYCLADPDFYETPTLATDASGDDDFQFSRCPVPDGWYRTTKDDWVVLRPIVERLPKQGWKIHVSACHDNAGDILDNVWSHCVPRGIAFKFLRGRRVLRTHNFKYAPRGSSGKFITIYPTDGELETTLRELDATLGGQPGPYILSDLRFAAGPLYVRYGGFVERYALSDDGTPHPAIEAPDGSLVPDLRDAAFAPPAWAPLPDFLAPHLAARNAVTTTGLDYRIDSAPHFSNGGGIYTGTDLRSGDKVILKEARPHAGLAADGSDAVTRLGRERKILDALSGLSTVPAFLDYFTLGEHHFLVQEFIEGEPLNAGITKRFPLNGPVGDPTELRAYVDWATEVCQTVERTVAALHDRNVVFGDLHPYNLLVRQDGRVCLIDFEVAAFVDEGFRPTLGDPGFTAPPDRTGFAIDDYALACLRLHVFLPLTTLRQRAPEKAAMLAREITATYPVDEEFLAPAVKVIAGGSNAEKSAVEMPTEWSTLRDRISTAIAASATPHRTDRLFPGDVEQFVSGGFGLAHGAAGVLYALSATGAHVEEQHLRWLLDRAERPTPGTGLGLYRGWHGVAYLLNRLGHLDAALNLLERCLADDWQRLGSDLTDGIAGIGLNLLRFAVTTGDTGLRDTAKRAAEILADRLGSLENVPGVSGGEHPYAGLLRGSSGVALFLLRMHQYTGDEGYLDLAGTALRQDLRRCLALPDGCVHVNEGWRTMPYLATGSAGIGLVADEYLRHRHDDGIAERAAGIRMAATGQFFVRSGLFNGRAGLVAYLSAAHPPSTAHRDPAIAEQIRRLGWHAFDHASGLAFAGDQLLRLSMDLATGGAGVLLALGMAMADRPVHLPGLEPL